MLVLLKSLLERLEHSMGVLDEIKILTEANTAAVSALAARVAAMEVVDPAEVAAIQTVLTANNAALAAIDPAPVVVPPAA